MSDGLGSLRGKSRFFKPGPPAQVGSASLSVLAFLRRNLADIAGPILDLGGGRGAYSAEMRSWGHDVTLAEVDPDCLSDASRLGIPTMDMRQSDWKTLERRYEALALIEVLEHVEDWRDFLDRAYSTCSRRLLITIPCTDDFEELFRYNLTYNHIAVTDHLHHFTTGELRDHFRSRGWEAGIGTGDPLWPDAILPLLNKRPGRSFLLGLGLLPIRIANRFGLLKRKWPSRMFIRIDKPPIQSRTP